MDPRDNLKDMLTNLINDDEAAASQAVHQYIVAKARELAATHPAHVEEDE